MTEFINSTSLASVNLTQIVEKIMKTRFVRKKIAIEIVAVKGTQFYANILKLIECANSKGQIG